MTRLLLSRLPRVSLYMWTLFTTISEAMLIYALKVALAVAGGLVLWIVPVLQHWVVYLLWGPIVGVVFCVGYAESVDYTSQGPIHRPD